MGVPVEVEYEVTIKQQMTMRANSFEEAIEQARILFPFAKITRYKKHWEPAAAAMLADGCSYNEVSRTLNVHRRDIAAKFPGQGSTREQGYLYREQKKQLDNLDNYA